MSEKQLHVNIDALQALHRFGDELEEAIHSINSETTEFSPFREAADSIGRHWYGMRCNMLCKKSGASFYLHIGLIYHKDTRVGLMVEVDEKNNLSTYSQIKEQIIQREEFEINLDEPEYFKLFMPNTIFEELMTKERPMQIKMLAKYVQSAGEAIAQAAYQKGFTLTFQDLHNARNLAEAFELALREMKSEYCTAEINYSDKDNFGQYAQGFRYYLKNKAETVCLYAYFGAIYSYKKQPAGIFAEIDWFSNQKDFDQVFEHMEESGGYHMSKNEPKFLKLFMKDEDIIKLNKECYVEQLEQLKSFLKTCNEQMIVAYERADK